MPAVWPATEDDIPRLLATAEAFLAYHPVTSQCPRDMDAIDAMLRRMIDADDACLLVHEHGVIGGVINPLWSNPSIKVASEMFWWADKGGRSLLDAFEAWAKENGANIVQMLAIMGRRDVTSVYDRRGYFPVEMSFMKAA